MSGRGLARALLIAVLIGGACGLPSPVRAIGANEALPDPALEARARNLFQQLRCLVCQNQSIDDSDADLARDLRVLVRERLDAGDSDEQVIAFLTRRYGDFVLLKPPFKASTVALWTAPFVLLLGGGAILIARARKRATPQAAPLTAEERARLERLLGGGEGGGT